VTYYPVPTQQQFQQNRTRIQGKPYARFFNGDLWISEDVLPALAAPMDARDALLPEDANRLLDERAHTVETGYCELPDGSAYVASKVPLPGVTGDMYSWWFWWHALESARYTLWYPHNHVSVESQQPELLTQPGLPNEQRYINTTHHVGEYIGPDFLRVAIRFVEPGEVGLDRSRFAAAGVVGHACARVAILGTGVESVTMIHLVHEVNGGLEQRSRYWIGHDPRLITPLGRVPLERVSSNTLRRKLAGARVAYEQLLHDQIEFTHLATFLPELYAELGPR